MTYRNHYRCNTCDTHWIEDRKVCIDDECPLCGVVSAPVLARLLPSEPEPEPDPEPGPGPAGIAAGSPISNPLDATCVERDLRPFDYGREAARSRHSPEQNPYHPHGDLPWLEWLAGYRYQRSELNLFQRDVQDLLQSTPEELRKAVALSVTLSILEENL